MKGHFLDKWRHLFFVLLLLLLLLLLAACTVDDEDRCPSGFVYFPESKGCLKLSERPPDGGFTDGHLRDAQAPQDQQGDAAKGPSGLGKSCTQSEECAGLDASYCAVDPSTKKGTCTIQNCRPKGCPKGLTCCDCKVIGLPVFCIPDEALGKLQGLCSCG
jgi:hypothetical protein